MPLISVVIPLYNKGFIIKETLESVLEQTFTDYEIIIVDDGSTDNGYEVVKEFSDNRIHLFQQENKGAASARNLGIEKSAGIYIAFLDADDHWETNHLEELVKLANKYPNCGAYCSRYQIKNSINSIHQPYFKNITNDFYGIVENYFASNHPYKINITLNQMIPRNILMELGCFTESITNGQDLELWTKIAIKYPVALHNKTTTTYNYYLPNSLSKKSIKSMKLMDFSQFLENEKQNEDLKDFLDKYRIEYALQYKIAGDYVNSKKYLTEVKKTNISLITKILFNIPSKILKKLLAFKHWLRKKGIDFTVYN